MAPQYMTVAGMSVTISHSTPNGKDQFKLIYTLPGALERETKNCGTIEEARAYAQSLEPKVRAELACTGTLVGEEWRRYEHARPDLKWLKMPVDEVVSERVAVKKLLGDRPLVPAVTSYLTMLPPDHKDMRLVDLKDQFLKEECTEGCRGDYTFFMNKLAEYIHALPGMDGALVSQVTTLMLSAWVFGSGGEHTQHHRREAAVRLFNYGKKVGCVPDGPRSVAQRVDPVYLSKKSVKIYAPDVVRELINLLWEKREEDPKYMQRLWYVVFCAFAGIRWKEMTRMTWEMVDYANRRLLLSPDITKTGEEREVPIQENLWQFLMILGHPSEGPIVYGQVRQDLVYFAKVNGLLWVRNGLRHSYGSYRLAVTKNIGELSEEMGNTPAVVKRHYRKVVTPAARDAYWAIFPPGYVLPATVAAV